MSEVDGSDPRTLARGMRSRHRPGWSPDGRYVSDVRGALFASSNLFLVEVEIGRVQNVTSYVRGGVGIGSHVWLPDGRHLVVAFSQRLGYARLLGSQEDLGILDVRDGSFTRLTLDVAQSFNSLSLSADGRRLVTTVSQTDREVWKVPLGPDPDANGRNAMRLLDRSHDPLFIFVSRDGSTLLYTSTRGGSSNLWIMPLDGSQPPRQVTTIGGVTHSSLSSDGSQVAFSAASSGHSDIWVQHVDGSGRRQLTDDEAADTWPIWSPDGQSILYRSVRQGESEEAWLVSVEGGPPEKVLDEAVRGDWRRRPDGAGTWMVSGIGGTVRLIDFEERDVLWDESLPGTNLTLSMFSPDGRSVSMPSVMGLGRDVIWIFDVMTGERRVGVRFPGRFRMAFRADWVDDGEELRQRMGN